MDQLFYEFVISTPDWAVKPDRSDFHYSVNNIYKEDGNATVLTPVGKIVASLETLGSIMLSLPLKFCPT